MTVIVRDILYFEGISTTEIKVVKVGNFYQNNAVGGGLTVLGNATDGNG